MFYGNSIIETRRLFYASWAKYKGKEQLTPLEQQIANVIIDHPEYHPLLDTTSAEDDLTYFPELDQTNPFMHMGLHLAIRDQIHTNRPLGISKVFQSLEKQLKSRLEAEHQMMDCLAEALWQAQRTGTPPNEQQFLNACHRLLKKS
jgi:hypothetical protein